MIGVDIGAKRTQVILLRRAEGTISLEKAASFPTSPEATTAGEFTNGLVVAEQLEEIWSGFDVKTSRVAVAVSGDRIFCQTHRPTADSAEQIESALRSEVESVAPYALKAATLDYDFVSGPDGDQLLWVCAPTEQVEWVREVIEFSGGSAEVVEAEACALTNAFAVNSKPRKDAGALLLHAGAGTLNACLLRGSELLASRTACLHDSASEDGHEAARIASEAHRLWELLSKQMRMDGVESISVSGGGARDEVVVAISEQFEVQATLFDPFQEIDLPRDSDAVGVVDEHRAACAVAVGLALRGFEDL